MTVWRAPGMPTLLAAAGLGFVGFAVLLPVAPMWAIHIGADSLGAGLVNMVLMACTVIAQLLVGRVLRRVSWPMTLSVGLLLLGAPALVHGYADTLWLVLVLAALRGLGFGILTVCGVDGIAGLVAPEHRGRAIGAYGLVLAAPQFILIPLAPWLSEHVGFGPVFASAGAPLLAIPLVLLWAKAVPRPPEPTGEHLSLVRGLVKPVATLVAVTAAGGALITFAPEFTSAETAFAVLLGLTGTAALSRWRVGALADRHGPRRFLAPMLATGAVGLGLVAAGIGGHHSVIVVGAVLVGVAYGGLQSLTLMAAFAAAGEHARSIVSVAWNVGFDTGTGLGALGVGAIATASSFPVAFSAVAAVCAMVALWWCRPRATRG